MDAQFSHVTDENGNLIFNGPRVRIGIHKGCADSVVQNSLTKLFNYYGAAAALTLQCVARSVAAPWSASTCLRTLGAMACAAHRRAFVALVRHALVSSIFRYRHAAENLAHGRKGRGDHQGRLGLGGRWPGALFCYSLLIRRRHGRASVGWRLGSRDKATEAVCVSVCVCVCVCECVSVSV